MCTYTYILKCYKYKILKLYLSIYYNRLTVSLRKIIFKEKHQCSLTSETSKILISKTLSLGTALFRTLNTLNTSRITKTNQSYASFFHLSGLLVASRRWRLPVPPYVCSYFTGKKRFWKPELFPIRTY